MNPVARALWFIEGHLEDDITLSDIASASGVSRYYLLRAFGVATGYSVMRYVRGRRLTEAARSLAEGAPDILCVALTARYSSHEAFTRAFLDQFGLTPRQARAQNPADTHRLLEPFTMPEELIVELAAPRVETAGAFLVAGLGERYSFETNQGIPLLWQHLAEHAGRIPGRIESVSYGVCCNSDEEGNFDYIAGVEVTSFSGLPDDLSRCSIPEQKYLVFTHQEHISAIRKTVYTIWNAWLPNSDYQQAEGPDFERYDERFDASTGTGGVEIWVPIK